MPVRHRRAFATTIALAATLVSLLVPTMGYSQNQAIGAIEAPPQDTYLKLLDIYGRNLRNRVEAATSIHVIENRSLTEAQRTLLLGTIEGFLRSSQARLDDFAMRYRSIFITDGRNSPYAKSLADDEAGMIKALDAGLEVLHSAFSQLRDGVRASNLVDEMAKLQAASNQLTQFGQLASNPLLKDLSLVLPTDPAQTAWTFFRNAVLRGDTVMSTMAAMPDETFLRDGHDHLQYEGWDPREARNFEGDSVFIIGFGHDAALFDVLMAQRVAAQIGVREPALLTVERSWPQYKLGVEREDNIIFIEDGEPIRRLIDFAKRSRNRKTVLTIAPEGQVPYPHAQFPVVTKPGAMVLARRLAAELAGKKRVFFVPVFSNGIEHLTDPSNQPMRVRIETPVLVPDAPVDGNDTWIEAMRRRFEVQANQRRGIRMVNLRNPTLMEGTALPVAAASSVNENPWVTPELSSLRSLSPWPEDHRPRAPRRGGTCALLFGPASR